MHFWRAAGTLVVVPVLVLGGMWHALGAEPAFTAGTTVAVDGGSVRAVTTIRSARPVTAESAGICARSTDVADGGRDADFTPAHGVRLDATGRRLKAVQTLPAGSYRAFACVLVDGTWHDVGSSARFVVATSATGAAATTPATTTAPTTAGSTSAGSADPRAAAPTAAASTAPAARGSVTSAQAPATTGSAVAAPGSATAPVDLVAAPHGDLPGWKQVFLDDFTTPVAEGSFPGRVYGSRWSGYDGFADNSGTGLYATSRITSVHDGVLDMFLRTEDGQALAAAPVPLVDGEWGGGTYGRYSVRFRADAVPGYGGGWLLWSDDNAWSDGEVDFPEGPLNGTIHAYNHRPGADPSANAYAVDTGASWNSWHTATTEWTPAGVRFIFDGRTIGVSTISPDKPMHLVLQTGTNPERAVPGQGHVYVDWISIYSWTP